MRPPLRFHSNKNILFSHTRDIQVYFLANRIQYEIPLYFLNEEILFGKKSVLRIDVSNSDTFLQPSRDIEIPNAFIFKTDDNQLK